MKRCFYDRMDSHPFEQPCKNLHSGEYLSEIPVPWMHTIPSYMPWSSQGNSKIPNIMKFTASTSILPSSSYSQSPLSLILPNSSLHHTHSKRKGSNLDDEIPIANKIYISEEKMVARLNDLHISQDSRIPNTASCNSDLRDTSNGYSVGLGNTETRMNTTNEGMMNSQGPTLVLAPELQNLQKADSILPPVILQKLQKSCMELMVWKPPEPVIYDLSTLPKAEKTQETSKGQQSSNTKETTPSVQNILKRASNEEGYIWANNLPCPLESKEMENESMDVL